MTTLLADAKLGVMVADSNVCDDDRVWSGRKVWRIRGALVGLAGADAEIQAFLDWYRAGMDGPVKMGESAALILDGHGVHLFDANYERPQRIERGREAIGTGGKAAMCVHEALGFLDPRKAVRIVCKHDAGSRGPVRVYSLKR